MPAPPAVIEILPSHGPCAGNTRVVILGSRHVLLLFFSTFSYACSFDCGLFLSPPKKRSGPPHCCRFVNSPHLRVRFGDVEVVPHFHEQVLRRAARLVVCLCAIVAHGRQGTLICASPPHPPGPAPVRVANDGKHFCETKVVFNYV